MVQKPCGYTSLHRYKTGGGEHIIHRTGIETSSPYDMLPFTNSGTYAALPNGT